MSCISVSHRSSDPSPPFFISDFCRGKGSEQYTQECDFSAVCYHNTYLTEVSGIQLHMQRAYIYTVEPPNKGHFGNGSFVLSSEVVPISEVHRVLILFSSLTCLNCFG